MQREEVLKQLMAEAEPLYRAFSANLLPGVQGILGVRLPTLRRLAKTIAKGDVEAYLQTKPGEYHEERLLRGLVIGILKEEPQVILRHIAEFIPEIDNWAICDSFCSGLKITKQHKNLVWEFLQPYFVSEEEYFARFAVVMLLNYYVEEDRMEEVLATLRSVQSQAYYAKMAVAWAISVCMAKDPEQTLRFLDKNSFDEFTIKKALQKSMESYRVSESTKSIIRQLR